LWVVTRDTERRKLAADLPGIAVFNSQAELLASGVDAVTITTPPSSAVEGRAITLPA